MGSSSIFAANITKETGFMRVNATLTNACTVSAATITFNSNSNKSNSAEITGDTGGSLRIACTTGTTPKIWSDTARTLVNNGESFTFNLSQTPGAETDDLPTTSAEAELLVNYTANGSPIEVPIYGKILASNLNSKLANVDYTIPITFRVNY